MNRQEYLLAVQSKVPGIRHWENKVKKLQRSLQFNPDPNARCRHHLQDTEAQIKYNDEHYEMWGFNLDGTFEYGKYIVFLTEAEHNQLHNESKLTRERISAGQKKCWENKDYHEYMSTIHKKFCEDNPEHIKHLNDVRKKFYEDHPEYIKYLSDTRKKFYEDHPEVKQQISDSRKGKCCGENHSMYGKHHTDETKNKISETQKANMTDEHRKVISEATKEAMKDPIIRQKIIDANTGENNPNYGKPRDDETRSKISQSKKSYMLKLGNLFREYKANGGTLKWRQFQTYAKDNHLLDDK